MPCRRNGQGGSAPARLTMPQGGRSAYRKSAFHHFYEESKFGQPEVARICKELILQAKSTTREAGKAGLHE